MVGAYAQTGRANNIYTNLSMLHYPYAYDEDLELCTLGGVYLAKSISGATFKIADCTDLTAVKQALYDMELSAVGKLRAVRNFVIINDAAYLNTERAAAQRLWYMQHLFPVVYAIALGLAYLIAFLQVQSRRKELRTMRSVGADSRTAYWSLYWEQLMLAALGPCWERACAWLWAGAPPWAWALLPPSPCCGCWEPMWLCAGPTAAIF